MSTIKELTLDQLLQDRERVKELNAEMQRQYESCFYELIKVCIEDFIIANAVNIRDGVKEALNIKLDKDPQLYRGLLEGYLKTVLFSDRSKGPVDAFTLNRDLDYIYQEYEMFAERSYHEERESRPLDFRGIAVKWGNDHAFEWRTIQHIRNCRFFSNEKDYYIDLYLLSADKIPVEHFVSKHKDRIDYSLLRRTELLESSFPDISKYAREETDELQIMTYHGLKAKVVQHLHKTTGKFKSLLGIEI